MMVCGLFSEKETAQLPSVRLAHFPNVETATDHSMSTAQSQSLFYSLYTNVSLADYCNTITLVTYNVKIDVQNLINIR